MPFRYVTNKDWLLSKPNIQRNSIWSQMFHSIKLPQKKHTFEFLCLSVISSQWRWTSYPHQLAETHDISPAKSGRNSTWTFSRCGKEEILYPIFQLKTNCSRFFAWTDDRSICQNMKEFSTILYRKSFTSAAIPHISVWKSA